MRRVFLASPREPSGVTWLVNCLLELGVCTWRHTRASMWREAGGMARLHPREDTLKRWLPALSTHAEFRFRSDVEVQWDHVWPTAAHRDVEVILFARDPRDALYSRYRRESPEVGYREFASFLAPWTLLDKVDTWCLYHRAWLAHPRVTVVRFEDYKKDAATTLRQALDVLGLSAKVDAAAFEAALAASGFERARDAEARYLATHPELKVELINRAGGVGSWRELSGPDATVADDLTRRGADLFRRFGWPGAPADAPPPADFTALMDALPFFSDVSPPPAADAVGDGAAEERIRAFADTLTADALTRSGLTADERDVLVHSLRHWLGEPHSARDARLAALAKDGGYYHYQVFKRTRRLADLRRVSPAYLGRMLLGKLKRLAG